MHLINTEDAFVIGQEMSPAEISKRVVSFREERMISDKKKFNAAQPNNIDVLVLLLF